MRGKFLWLLILAAGLGLPRPALSQQYTDVFLNSINRTWVAPCGGPGADVTAQIQNVFQNLKATNGGTLDLSCYQADEILTADIFSTVTVPITLILPTHTVTVDANTTIPSNFTIVYLAGSALAAGPGFALVDNSTPVRSATGYQQLDPGVAGAVALTPGAAGTCAIGAKYYVVTSRPSSGGETQGSAEAHVTLTAGQTSVGLAWTADAYAATYRIYRGTSSGGENVYYTSATNSFTDTCAAGTGGTPPPVNTAWLPLAAGGGAISGLTAGTIPVALTPTTLANSSPAITQAGGKTFFGPLGGAPSPFSIGCDPSDATHTFNVCTKINDSIANTFTNTVATGPTVGNESVGVFIENNRTSTSADQSVVTGLEAVARSRGAGAELTIRGANIRTYVDDTLGGTAISSVGIDGSVRASGAVVADPGTAFVGIRSYMAPGFTGGTLANVTNFHAFWGYNESATQAVTNGFYLSDGGGGFTYGLNLSGSTYSGGDIKFHDGTVQNTAASGSACGSAGELCYNGGGVSGSLVSPGGAIYSAPSALATPTLTVTPTFTGAHANPWAYTKVCGFGILLSNSPVSVSANNAATLDASNYNTINGACPAGYTYYLVNRTTVGTSPTSVGYLNAPAGTAVGTPFVDNGVAGDGNSPQTTNQTASMGLTRLNVGSLDLTGELESDYAVGIVKVGVASPTYGIDSLVIGDAGGDDVVAGQFSTIVKSNQFAEAVGAVAVNKSSVTVDDIDGINAKIFNQTVNTISSVQVIVSAYVDQTGGSATLVRNLLAALPTLTNGATIVTAEGVYVDDMHPAGVTNSRGIFIENQGAASTSALAIKTGTGINQFGDLTTIGPYTISGGSLNLPAAASWTGYMVTVTDSTTVAAEGQTCSHTASNPVTALAFSNGTVWKCL